MSDDSASCSDGILIYIPWPTNTGYAMHRTESDFLQMAQSLPLDLKRIHFAYTSLAGGHPKSLPADFANVHELSLRRSAPTHLDAVLQLISERSIDLFLGYDLGVENRAYRKLRRAGIVTIVSFWGAPMSSVNSGIKLVLKRLEVLAHRHRPDHFVFESRAMQKTGVDGRGLSADETSVVYTGVEASLLVPRDLGSTYVHEQFAVPGHRKVVAYSGHIHERKGVGVLVDAAIELVRERRREDLHFLLLGAIQEVSQRFVDRVNQAGIQENVTFAGYRDDIFKLLSGCWLGVAPTTGWDSFPRSVLEMQGTGLPVIVSNLQGLPEMIEDRVTGLMFEPGNHMELADRIEHLVDNEQVNAEFGIRARARILDYFTQERFVRDLTDVVRKSHVRRMVHKRS